MPHDPADDRAAAPRRRPGGRSSRVRAAVTAATFDLLDEVGYDRMQLTDVAARAGVNKSTVYRRWSTKADLVADLFIELAEAEAPTPDTGSLARDLEELLREAVALLKRKRIRSVLGALISQTDDGSLARARSVFWADRVGRSSAIVARAVERGELPPDTDGDRFMHAVFGPVYLRLVVFGEDVDDDYLRALSRMGALTGDAVPWTTRDRREEPS